MPKHATKNKQQGTAAQERTCIYCGCTDSVSCRGGCYWVEQHKHTNTGVCNQCRGLTAQWFLAAALSDMVELWKRWPNVSAHQMQQAQRNAKRALKEHEKTV